MEPTERKLKSPALLTPEKLIGNGYELASGERVVFERDMSKAQVHRETLNGVKAEYKSVVGIRVGGTKTYTHLEVMAIQGSNMDDIHYAVRALSPDYPSFKAPVAVADLEGGIIGRESISSHDGSAPFSDLPDTVSRSHLMVQVDQDGRLVVRNLNPSNFTTLYNVDFEWQKQTPDEPRIMNATRVVNPRTGESTSGGTLGYPGEPERAAKEGKQRLAHEERFGSAVLHRTVRYRGA